MENTTRFAIDSRLDLAVFYCATPFPGTELYDICVDEGITVPEHTSIMMGGVGSLEMDAEEIARVREEATSRFMKNLMKRPWKPLGKIRSLEDLRYVMKVAKYGLRLALSSSSGKSTTAFLYSPRGERPEGR